MVLDKIENLGMYTSLNKTFAYVKNFLETTDLMSLEVGRYDLEHGCYYMVQEYAARKEEDCRFEAHLKFIDLQLVIKGFEDIGYTGLENLEVKIPYDKEKDAEFYTAKSEFMRILLEKDHFVIFFPDDPHKACMESYAPSDIKKIVVKIPVE